MSKLNIYELKCFYWTYVPFECGIIKEIQSMIQLSTLNTYDLPIVLNRQKKNITKEKFMIQ